MRACRTDSGRSARTAVLLAPLESPALSPPPADLNHRVSLEQVVTPSVGATFPAAHESQLPLPAESWKRPASHFVHVRARRKGDRVARGTRGGGGARASAQCFQERRGVA